MPKKPISIRIDSDLLSRVDRHCEGEGSTRISLIEEGLERVLGGKRVVPDDEAARKALREADRRAKDAIDSVATGKSPASDSDAIAAHLAAEKVVERSKRHKGEVPDAPEPLKQAYRNGDEGLIQEEMRRLTHRIPVSYQRRAAAIQNLKKEGKLHA